jgi:hypothetical protein
VVSSRLLAVTLVGALSIGSVVAADPEAPPTAADSDRATKLFEEGRTLAKKGDWVAACDRFQQALDIDPSALGTALNLADCYEKRAQTAKAWHLFDKVARRGAHSATESDAKKGSYAHDRAETLRVQLVSVDVRVPGHVPDGFALSINGQPVTQISGEMQDVADPGAIVVEATAPGKPPFHAELRGAAGSTVSIDVVFGDGEVVARPAREPAAGATVHRRSGWVTGAFVVGGAGVAAALVGLGFGYEARSDHDDVLSSNECHDTAAGLSCTAAGAEKERHAATLANVSTGLTVGGLALAAGGVALFMLAPQDREQKDHLGLGPIVTTSQLGVALGGRF